jgi:hypothetical protein
MATVANGLMASGGRAPMGVDRMSEWENPREADRHRIPRLPTLRRPHSLK